MSETSPHDRPRIAVLGGGSAGEMLADLIGNDAEVLVFEPGLVGGECPFLACMPSKAMLHEAAAGTDWSDAIARRDEITDHRDDSSHAADLVDHGATLIRERAVIDGPGAIVAGGMRYAVDHIVVATGADPIRPPLDGAEEFAEFVWTSEDLYRATERPDRVVIVGGGVIGFESAEVFSRFGSTVTVVDEVDRPFDSLPEAVGVTVQEALEGRGVRFRFGSGAAAIHPEPDGPGVLVELESGERFAADRILLAVGRRPRTEDIGLESLGLDPTEPLPVGPTGRVDSSGSLWAMGDVAGLGQYTHLANHQAKVIADHLLAGGERRFDDVVLASCVFTDPPLIQVGDWATVTDSSNDSSNDDIVIATKDLASFPRASTDRLGPGYLAVAASRRSGTAVAAAGAGARFDELVHALVIAIDGASRSPAWPSRCNRSRPSARSSGRSGRTSPSN
ncbi:MAG: FAD-dependent oxidoreductase [Ilumatobacteraceae bacterium]